jgi:alpha-tubulin suppressor-like RCC1 family protein
VLGLSVTVAATTVSSAATTSSLKSWGLNGYGEVGDGTSTGPQHCHLQSCANQPVAVTGLSVGQVKQISTGDEFSLALMTNGTVRAWGENDYGGELGDGTASGPSHCAGRACSVTPVAVCAVGQSSCTFTSRELTNVLAISAGDYMSLALLKNGTVVSWGANQLGELGDGTTTGPDTSCGGESPCSTTPVPVCAVSHTSCTTTSNELTNVIAISSGNGANLALLSNGTVATWGESAYLGDGTTIGSSCSGSCTPDPRVVCAVAGCASGPLSGVKAIDAADEWGLALLTTNKVAAWGTVSNGELGDGPNSGPYVTTPRYVCAVGGCGHGDLTDVTSIAGDDDFSMALLSNATVVTWGEGTQGQLGDGALADSNVPVLVCAMAARSCTAKAHELTSVVEIASGESAYAVLKSGVVRAWGVNTSGELGDGSSTGPQSCITLHNGCSDAPVAVSGLSHVTSISAGEFDAIAKSN